jgi:hypothetical protein
MISEFLSSSSAGSGKPEGSLLDAFQAAAATDPCAASAPAPQWACIGAQALSLTDIRSDNSRRRQEQQVVLLFYSVLFCSVILLCYVIILYSFLRYHVMFILTNNFLVYGKLIVILAISLCPYHTCYAGIDRVARERRRKSLQSF